MSFDKSKFVAREGDSEGFEDGARNHAMVCPIKAYPLNPKGWQEVDGVKLPPVATWAEPTVSTAVRLDAQLRALTDTVLEETFQSWVRGCTTPGNMDSYRKELRRRIEVMVEKAGYGTARHVVDLSRLS